MTLRLRLLLGVLAPLVALSAAADINVIIRGVDGDARENVRAVLSLSRYESTAESRLEVDSLAARAEQEIRDALRPFGYYEPRAAVNIEAAEDNWRATVTIEPGQRLLWRRIVIDTNGVNLSYPDAQLRRDAPVDHRDYEAVKSALERSAVANGYFDWKWTTRRLVVSPATGSADALLVMDAGARYRIGEVVLDQDAVDDELAQRYLRFEGGDYFSQAAVLETQYGMTDSGYFAQVQIDTGDEDKEAKTVPVTVSARAGQRQRFSVGVGYGTDTRARGSARWQLRRVNGRGHRAQVHLTASELRQETGFTYTLPGRDPLVERKTLGANWISEKLADTQSRRFSLSAGDTRRWRGWQWRRFVELIDERTAIPGEPERSDTLFVPGIGLDRVVRDQAINPNFGSRYRAELRGSQQGLFSDTDFVRLEVEGRWLRSFTDNYRFLARAALGTSWVEEFVELPASQRFFAGGDDSIRGFSFNGLSPTNADGEIVGGRHRVVLTAELERRIRGPWYFAIFSDYGGAVDNLSDDLEWSAGIGVHRTTPIGTLRIEVAKPMSIGDRSPRFHLSLRPDL